MLVKALAKGLALDLSTLYLGGNRVSSSGMALSSSLKQMRRDLVVNWKAQLHDAQASPPHSSRT